MQPWHISAPSIPDLQQLRQFDIPLLGEKDLRNLLLRPDIVERRRSLKSTTPTHGVGCARRLCKYVTAIIPQDL